MSVAPHKTPLLRAAMAIAGKDLTIELRTREIPVSTGFFAVLIAALTSLSFFVDEALSRNVAPGVLFIAIVAGHGGLISRRVVRRALAGTARARRP